MKEKHSTTEHVGFPEERRSITGRDVFIMVAIAAVAIAALLVRSLFAKEGAYAHVSIIGKDAIEISLQKDEIYHIDSNLPVTLEVKDGAIAFVQSQCPDHLCEGFGFISQEGEKATCMPAGVEILIMDD